MNTVTLDAVQRTFHKLPSLPALVMELLASLGQENVVIDELAQKIAQDLALTAKALQLANSSFYGMTRQINTIEDAISILGFRTVSSLATTAALINAFAGSARTRAHIYPFWNHAIAVAVCARELATQLGIDPEPAYTAGLLHDIGRLVLVTQFAPKYERSMAYRAQHDCSVLEAEHAVLGLDHAAVGHALAQHWKFPEELQQALASHHAPQIALAQPLTVLVCAADAIAHALDLSPHADDRVPSLPAGLWRQLGLDENALLAVFQNVENQFAGARLVLDL